MTRAVEGEEERMQRAPWVWKKSLFVYVVLLGGVSCALFIMLGIMAFRNIALDKALIVQNALTQGYWIARALESSHRTVTQEHEHVVRQLIRDIERNSTVRFVLILDDASRVLLASDATLEGTTWPDRLEAPPARGAVLKSEHHTIDVIFPASFADAAAGLHYHPQGNGALNNAKWVILEIDASAAHEHHRGMVLQTVLISIGVMTFGLSAFLLLGMIQRYALAHASIHKLEHIKHQLASFVPGTVRRLIEENPEQPLLDKVERHATGMFLDIEQYARIAEDMAPEALNHLIEHYFSAFLDIILSHDGEINEMAGDGIMAIFTGRTPRAHALNAAEAAVAIRQQAHALNQAKAPSEPAITVNIGINTGQVLLGATMIKGMGDARLTYTASGSVTNLAARLCDFGSQGAIHLSETTAHLVQEHFTLRAPREVHLKNLRGTISVYTL